MVHCLFVASIRSRSSQSAVRTLPQLVVCNRSGGTALSRGQPVEDPGKLGAWSVVAEAFYQKEKVHQDGPNPSVRLFLRCSRKTLAAVALTSIEVLN